ncbi:hypothetical protein R4282_20060 [Rhodococcus oxybenzonivorans]|uniref:hypothetical protein n=1 Tax=Rhodococcus oxybenzonivorans TaxID=1990687 RepID=UPI0029557AA0|nr:hypothetical protein [Rhodococcus oxybenzonivorans]MDV7355294.1 hypothetical protein [Rhodococcus oxybenzonivorans]
MAFVEIRAGHTLRGEELIEFCQGRIGRYKIPRAVYFLRSHEWPMSATKINKRQLQVRLAELTTDVDVPQ